MSLLTSCGNSPNKQETNGTNVTASNTTDTPQQSPVKEEQEEQDPSPLYEACLKYFDQRDSLNKIKHQYFRQFVMEPALKNAKLPKANRDLLKSLDDYLQLDDEARYTMATLDQFLLPIFRLDTTQIGVVDDPNYNVENTDKLVEANVDPALQKRIAEVKMDRENMEKLNQFQTTFNEVYSTEDLSTFIFTDKRRTTSSIDNFSYYFDDCLEYFHYSISEQNINMDEKVLFGSKYPLELEYENHPPVDTLMKAEYADGCYDCSFKFEPKTTFATLVGVENLYFTYTDTFPINNEFDYPERALVMIVDESLVVNLWLENVDLFGCSCL